MDRLADNYLFRSVDRDDLRRWCRGLRWFRFQRALGGHANDGDLLVAAVRAATWDEVTQAAVGLGLAGPIGRARSERQAEDAGGRPYFSAGRLELWGVPVYVHVHAGALLLEVFGGSGDIYSVTETDFERARLLEDRFRGLGLDFLDPPVAGAHCIHPGLYPEFFRDD